VQAAVFEVERARHPDRRPALRPLPVGVVTDMGEVEDVGELYVRDADALFNVVRSQVDVSCPSGVAVLNAADPQVVKLAELCDGGVIFYALDENNGDAAHRAAGGARRLPARPAHRAGPGQRRCAAARPGQAEAAHGRQPEAVLAAPPPAGRWTCRRPDLRRPAQLRCEPEANDTTAGARPSQSLARVH
jgi:cyanophycin synthetase